MSKSSQRKVSWIKQGQVLGYSGQPLPKPSSDKQKNKWIRFGYQNGKAMLLQERSELRIEELDEI